MAKQVKYLDHTFKQVRSKDARATAVLFAGVSVESKAAIKNFTKRIQLAHLDPDCVNSAAGERSKHIEAFAVWKSDILERVHGYASGFRLVYGWVPETTVVLFKKEGTPAHVKAEMSYSFTDGPLTGSIRFRVAKVWEMDPEEVFALESDAALPLIVFMKCTSEHLDRAFARIRELSKSDPAAASALATDMTACAGLRYDWNELELSILGRMSMFIKEEIMAESSFYKHIRGLGFEEGIGKGIEKGIEEGIEKGIEKGKAEGKAEGKFEVVLDMLAERFPGLETSALLKEFPARGLNAVDGLYQSIKSATTRAEALKAIRAAARG